MAVPVKVSDRLLALAKEEAGSTHRSATAQIEHWATLGRAVEALVAYADVLALKKAGQVLPMPSLLPRDDVHALLARLADEGDRESVRARIRAGGGPVYAAHPADPERVIAIPPEGALVHARLKRRRMATPRRKPAARRK